MPLDKTDEPFSSQRRENRNIRCVVKIARRGVCADEEQEQVTRTSYFSIHFLFNITWPFEAYLLVIRTFFFIRKISIDIEMLLICSLYIYILCKIYYILVELRKP